MGSGNELGAHGPLTFEKVIWNLISQESAAYRQGRID